MLKDLEAIWGCKDDGLKSHVGWAFLPASYLATTNAHPTIPFKPQAHAFLPASYLAPTNGRPTIAFNTQDHVGRAFLPALTPATTNGRPT